MVNKVEEFQHMKYIKLSLLTLLWISSQSLWNGSQAQLPFQDGFESGDFVAGAWTVSGNTVISTQAPSEGLYCAEGTGSWGLNKTIPSITDTMLYVEFDVRTGQTNTTCLIFR